MLHDIATTIKLTCSSHALPLSWHTAAMCQHFRGCRRSLARAANKVTHCNTLQHAVTYCNTLQHTATHCNTLQQPLARTCRHQSDSLQKSTLYSLQHTATHCNTPQHTATHCNKLEQTAPRSHVLPTRWKFAKDRLLLTLL